MNVRFLLLGAIAVIVFSCGPEKRAMKNFKAVKYQTVIEYYKKVLAKNPGNGRANFFVAESYRLSNRIGEAEPYYPKASGKGIDRDSMQLFYSQALKANGKYDEARKTLQDLESGSENQKIKSAAQKGLDGLGALSTISEKKNYYRIKNMESLNTPEAEFAPVYLNGELYFSSSRNNSKIYEASGTPYIDLYKAESKGANVDVSTIKPLSSVINDAYVHEATQTFSPDGKIMVYGKGNTGKKKGAYDIDLYMSRFKNGEWSEGVPININTVVKDNDPSTTNYSWDSQPAFSPDGRTLYFASNRKGGYGGTDIYSAQMDSRGRFGKVRNLGADINTPGDEGFPYVADNGKMYFSSDGHPGFGQLDLFVVNRANGKTVIQNLGQPINSTADDFGMFLFKADRGFFTSNRPGGKGDDDLYTFINEDPNLRVINYYLQGVTYSLKDTVRQILPDTKVTLLDAKGDVMQDFTTGNDGKFLFRVYENENYNLVGESGGFLTTREAYTTIGKSVPLESVKELVTNITLDTILVLQKKAKGIAYRLKNIYFGYDSANINPLAARELDKLVDVLNDNPEIKIEMGSHTDSVASDSYNNELSQRRAQSTVNYLIRKGIEPARLTAKGYGESKPIARNTNRNGTDNPEGRQRNRRTEFKILEIGIQQQKSEDELDEDDKYFKGTGASDN